MTYQSSRLSKKRSPKRFSSNHNVSKQKKLTIKKNNVSRVEIPMKSSKKKKSHNSIKKKSLKKGKGGGMGEQIGNMTKGLFKANQVKNRLIQLGSLFAFMPNATEVAGRNKDSFAGKMGVNQTLDNSTLGNPIGKFTKNMWRNLKANLLALASIDHLTFLKMNLVNPNDVADFVQGYNYLKDSVNVNVNGEKRVNDFQRERLGIKDKDQKINDLKDDIRILIKNACQPMNTGDDAQKIISNRPNDGMINNLYVEGDNSKTADEAVSSEDPNVDVASSETVPVDTGTVATSTQNSLGKMGSKLMGRLRGSRPAPATNI